jgi:poly(3-hydroxybutyrate) depolymerase
MQKILNLALAAVFLNCLFITATLSAATTAPQMMQVRSFTHHGYNRPYLIYRPVHAPRAPAVVVMLGGITSTAQSASQEFGWTALADRYGFLVVFPDPVRTNLTQPPNKEKNITFWEMRGSRTHILAPGAPAVDDDGYLIAVLNGVVHRDHPDRSRIFFAGFSSGSGMAQLFASRHPEIVSGVVAVATPLMDPPVQLARPVPILYIHGDKDESFTGFETHSPNFATTPHGNWVTWGYLDGCQKQTAKKTAWGVQFSWEGCREGVRVIADFVAGVGHEWEGSRSWDRHGLQAPAPLDFTDAAWQFLANIHPHESTR